jgi:hypothetical protein
VQEGEACATDLVEVDVHALELQIGGTIVHTRAVEAMLARDVLPVGRYVSCCTAILLFAGERTRRQHRFGYPKNCQEQVG